jgi:hypothetical protein
MKITVLGLATAGLLLSAGIAVAIDSGPPAQQGGVSSSPGVAGGRVPAETPPDPGMLPRTPGPYPKAGVTSPSTGTGSSAVPPPSSGSAGPSSGNPG